MLTNLLLKIQSVAGVIMKTIGADGDVAAPTWWSSISSAITNLLKSILVPIFFVLATMGVVYAIILGVQYAKAESTDKKEEAKKRIINTVIGVTVMICLVIIFWIVSLNIDSIVEWITGWSESGTTTTTTE